MAAEAKDEYFDVSTNARHFQTLRFAELTVFGALTAGLATVSFSRIAAPSDEIAATALKVAGIVVTMLFWALHERTMLYWRHFVGRAAELEPELGFRQYSDRPKEGWLSSNRAMRALFAALLALWAISLLRPIGFG